MGEQVSDAAPATPLPRWKRVVFTLVTLSLPLLLLGVVEVVLRLFGWGGYPPFIREVGPLPGGGALCLVEYGAFKPYFFANPTRPGYTEARTFAMPKPAGTVRIFLVGESAAKGYPQPSNLAMSSFLQSMLQDAWPDRKVEVINLGTTAVASFPLIYQVREALRFSPDLMVFYVGNNEFFGAYGTASINASGTSPAWALPLMRAARGLALVQAVEGFLHRGSDESRTLMEQMIGQTFIPADAPLREAAARNLGLHMERMLAQAKAAGVPAIVCTTASNESGMGPLGEDDLRELTEAQKAEFERLLKAAADPAAGGLVAVKVPLSAEAAGHADVIEAIRKAAIEALRKSVAMAPRSAVARFRLGQALAAAGDLKAAREAFLQARDLDTMPWRPTSGTEQAVRDAAARQGAVLCDVAERFRDLGEGGATGWRLLDDHVHPSLEGQAEVARCVVGCMAGLPGSLSVPESVAAGLPGNADYEARLGSNPWDDYRVSHTIRTLLGVPFMRRNNEEAFGRVQARCRDFESAQPADVRQVMDEWKTAVPHAGGMRPLTGMVARVMLRQKRTSDALPLYAIAQRQVPDHTSWHLEYIYFELACREQLQGKLDEAQRQRAAEAIEEAKFLLSRGSSESGLAERYTGRLHQLRGEWAEAIPYLLAARPKMRAEDLVACDQALFMSYVNTGNRPAAIMLCDDGIRNAGQFAGTYRALRAQLGN
ncbi:MAG: tetratricopeptide repeat protein [Planctomycetes bacterium]|nr:tetratricopeptide repeat protein [Planctomycetota bacterium]